MPGMVPGVAGGGPVFAPRPLPPHYVDLGAKNALPGSLSAAGAVGLPATGAWPTATGRADVPGPAVLISYTAVWGTPANGSKTQLLSPLISVTPYSSAGGTVDWQVQSALDATFTTSVTLTTLLAATSGVSASTNIGPFSNLSTIFLRARAGSQASDSWGLWSGTVSVGIDTRVGNAAEHFYMNVGVYLNQGRNTAEHAYMNVGVFLNQSRDTAEHVYMNVDTNSPTPFVFAVWPTSGRSGDGIKILGTGFGATQSTYSAVVQMLISGTWTNVSVTAWTQVAATANAYTANRQITPSTGVVDPEHIEIEFTIPGSAFPPGHQVRVQTVT